VKRKKKKKKKGREKRKTKPKEKETPPPRRATESLASIDLEEIKIRRRESPARAKTRETNSPPSLP